MSEMAEELEGTAEFNRYHRLVTAEIPITVANSVVDMFTPQSDKDDDDE
jgi:hypothetical protein